MIPKNTQEVVSSTSFGGITIDYRDGVTVLTLLGEHDMSTVEKLAFNIAEQIARSRGVVASLTETQFIDSSIVRELFRGDREMLRHGRRLVLHMGDNQAVRRVLDVVCAEQQLLCCDSLEEAIEFASQHAG